MPTKLKHRRMTKQEKLNVIRRWRALRQQGWPFKKIADHFNVTQGTVQYWVDPNYRARLKKKNKVDIRKKRAIDKRKPASPQYRGFAKNKYEESYKVPYRRKKRRI